MSSTPSRHSAASIHDGHGSVARRGPGSLHGGHGAPATKRSISGSISGSSDSEEGVSSHFGRQRYHYHEEREHRHRNSRERSDRDRRHRDPELEERERRRRDREREERERRRRDREREERERGRRDREREEMMSKQRRRDREEKEKESENDREKKKNHDRDTNMEKGKVEVSEMKKGKGNDTEMSKEGQRKERKSRWEQPSNEMNKEDGARKERKSRWDEPNDDGAHSTLGVMASDSTTAFATLVPRPEVPQSDVSECLLLKNVFDGSIQRENDFYLDVRDYLHRNCVRCGPVCHIHVDRKGLVYLRFDSARSAMRAMAKWHQSLYEGRIITAEYMDSVKYRSRFSR